MSVQLVQNTPASEYAQCPLTTLVFARKDSADVIAETLLMGVAGFMQSVRALPEVEQPYWLECVITRLSFHHAFTSVPNADDDEAVNAAERVRFAEILDEYGFDLYARMVRETPDLWSKVALS